MNKTLFEESPHFLVSEIPLRDTGCQDRGSGLRKRQRQMEELRQIFQSLTRTQSLLEQDSENEPRIFKSDNAMY